MSNQKEYTRIYAESFGLTEDEAPGTVLSSLEGWDSLSHLSFASRLEETFHVTITIGELIKVQSYDDGIALLRQLGVSI